MAQRRQTQEHDHPGGSGAILGVRLLRYSGVQGATLVIANLIQLVSVMVVAAYLGPAEMGRFALLLFLAGLVTQLLSLLVKPGTIRRVFGGGDDEDDDEDEESVVSTSPPRTLGTGLVWAAVLGVLGTALVVLLRRPIADLLLGDPEDADLVLWAGVLAGVWLVFKIADITLWLERRPGAFVVADTARPVLGLAALTALLASGAGIEGAIIGTAIGTAVAAIVAIVLLRGSYEPSFDPAEVKQIVLRGGTGRRSCSRSGSSRTPTCSSSRDSSATPSSASTRSPRGSASSSPSCPRASGWRCARCASRPPSRRSATSTGGRPCRASCSATSPCCASSPSW